ncbi:GMC family oxidoreductase [Legionella sp. W05-934-2]|uniref:GMC family oxidoreductase n=1 Tax=Legionella sp. W05-934-2 TaxID=1198649 RepID=UPI0034625E2D
MFDYIIIGGGSAGCVLASRLSVNPDNRVCLIEAGGSHHRAAVQIPFLTILTMPWWYKNWHYRTEPQPGLNNRRGYQPRGKVLGGSSAINAMIYIRGQQQDYDNWAKAGGSQWRFDNILPVFKAFENNQRLNGPYHGQSGELYVSDLISPNPASEAFVKAAIGCGYPFNHDFNGESQYGVGLYQVTQKNGLRHTSAHAFIDPIFQRKNLTILTKSHALKLLFNGKTCEGVTIKRGGKTEDIKAKKHVILCAGAISSPHLLLLSGIGDKDQLAQHGIRCHHHLPGVGLNFHDHPDYVHCYRSTNHNLIGFTPGALFDIAKAWFLYRKQPTGLMTTNYAEAGGFLSTTKTPDRPDIQLHFVTGIVDNHAHRFHFPRGMSCHVCVLRPKSRGSIRLKSADPFKAPAIDPNFLANDDDMNTLLNGYKMTLDIMEHEQLSPFRDKPYYIATSDEAIIELIRNRADTVYHPVGSCRMGEDELAVVDGQLKVHGIEKLTVADASIMPEVVSGNTNAPSMVIGEMAARFILSQDSH